MATSCGYESHHRHQSRASTRNTRAGLSFFAYASVLAPKCPLFCLQQTPGRARSRYALRGFSFARCTARVLTGIFFVYDRQRDAGLHSFWVQRYFSFSITIEGVSISFAKHRVIFFLCNTISSYLAHNKSHIRFASLSVSLVSLCGLVYLG